MRSIYIAALISALSAGCLWSQAPQAPVPATPASTPEVKTEAPALQAPAADPREAALEKMLTPRRKFASGINAVVLRGTSEDRPLDGVVGSFSTTWAFVTVLFYSDFPDAAAPIRTKETTPRILVSYDASPRGRLFLVKAKVNSSKRTRSVKVGTSGYGSVSSVTSPDQDWVIPTKSREVKPGLWEFIPNEPLQPGEYGLFATVQAGNMGAGGGELFDFGVDR